MSPFLPEKMIENRRKYPRVSVTTELWIGQDGIFTRADERLADLSLGGAFIETSQFYPVGSVLSLRFKLPNIFSLITCTAIVRRTVYNQGFGVEFLDLSPEDSSKLESFLASQIY
jgi:c-di-GMP-binding flagellar brake protein YcgR